MLRAYESPFKLLGAVAVPVVGGIFYNQWGSSHLKFSQKVRASFCLKGPRTLDAPCHFQNNPENKRGNVLGANINSW
jgi:hypothetical protein